MNRLLRHAATTATLALAAAGLTTTVADTLAQPADTATDTAWGNPPSDSAPAPAEPADGNDSPVTTQDTAWG